MWYALVVASLAAVVWMPRQCVSSAYALAVVSFRLSVFLVLLVKFCDDTPSRAAKFCHDVRWEMQLVRVAGCQDSA